MRLTYSEFGFDGLVVEMMYHIVKQGLPSLLPGVREFVHKLGSDLHANGNQLLLAVAVSNTEALVAY